MLFNSLAFLVFFAVFFLPYFALRGRARTVFLLAASYVFYGWWDWRFLSLLVLTTTVDHAVGIRLEGEGRPGRRRALLAASLVTNLSILGFFKYFNFFSGSFSALAGMLGWSLHAPAWKVLLPVGISFYTFQSLSYVVDVYRGHVEAERDWLRYAAYLAFFPQLVAGPIERAHHLLPQFRQDFAYDGKRALSGLQLAVWGFLKKLVLADTLAPLVEQRFAFPGLHGPLDLLLGVYFFAFQVYGDFSGYSDIARGTARILGFDLMVNFDRPFFAVSMRELWTRWHVSLSRWLRDYVYVSLGGSRGTSMRTAVHVMTAMLLVGLWHGAGWNFVLWGALHGIFLIGEHMLGWKKDARGFSGAWRGIRAWAARFAVFHLFCAPLLIFRSQDFAHAWDYLSGLAQWGAPGAFTLWQALLVVKAALLCAALMALEALSFRVDFASALERRPLLQAAALAAGVWAILLLGNFSGQRFFYFQF